MGATFLLSGLTGIVGLGLVLLSGRRLTPSLVLFIERVTRLLGIPVLAITTIAAITILHPTAEEAALLIYSLVFLTWIGWRHHRRAWHHWVAGLFLVDFLLAEWVLSVGRFVAQ